MSRGAPRCVAAFALALSVAGCGQDDESPAAPVCEADAECVIAGVDLVVDSIVPLWPAGQRTDSLTGRIVALPGDTVSVRWTVWNRGDEAAPPSVLRVCAALFPGCAGWWEDGEPKGDGAVIELPAFPAGGRMTGVSSVPLPERPYRDTLRLAAELDWRTLVDDPLYANDLLQTGLLYVAVPMPTARLILPDTLFPYDTSYTVRVEITNGSRFAALPAGTGKPCFAHFDVVCAIGFTPVPTPAVGPGATVGFDIELAITGDENYYYDGFERYYPVLCLYRNGEEGLYLPWCDGSGDPAWVGSTRGASAGRAQMSSP